MVDQNIKVLGRTDKQWAQSRYKVLENPGAADSGDIPL